MHNRSTSTSLEKGQSLMRICISMDPDFFITVLHVPDGPHFSKSGTAMVVPVVAGATPLYVVVFWTLSRLVLVRKGCDAAFLLYSQSNMVEQAVTCSWVPKSPGHHASRRQLSHQGSTRVTRRNAASQPFRTKTNRLSVQKTTTYGPIAVIHAFIRTKWRF